MLFIILGIVIILVVLAILIFLIVHKAITHTMSLFMDDFLLDGEEETIYDETRYSKEPIWICRSNCI